jgi:hypothetical protein
LWKTKASIIRCAKSKREGGDCGKGKLGKIFSILTGAVETHIQRQAALHDRLPELLGGRDTQIELVYGEEQNILYIADQSSQGRIKFCLYWHDEPNVGPLTFVLFESPFTSVSTISKGDPSLVSLILTLKLESQATAFRVYASRSFN